jgi:CHAD domain-containing protein
MPIVHKRSQLVFQKLERDLLKLSSKPREENVHSFRTSTGRLRVLLEELVAERSHNQKKLLKTLGRIRKQAGKLRDLDVQLATLRSLKFAQDPRRKTELTQALIELRAEHEKKLRKILTTEAVREIRRRLKRVAKKRIAKKKASKESGLEPGPDPLVAARKILQRVTPPARPSGAGPLSPMSEDVLHKLRIAVKRARYAAEFAPKSVEAEHFITQLKRLQNTLGHWHDWLTLTHAASDRFGDLRESALVAAMHNVTREKFRLAVAAVTASPVTPARLKLAPTAVEHPRKLGGKTPPPHRTESAA